MLLRTRSAHEPRPSEITPKILHQNRRAVLQAAVAGLATWSAAGIAQGAAADNAGAGRSGATRLPARPGALSTIERPTSYKDVTGYNNFYEFGTDKDDPARYAGSLRVRPWTVTVEGEVARARVFDIDELLKLAPLEERVYRMRCVEGWSMVIPWVGYSLAELIRRVEPTGNAKYVEFVTLADAGQMPGLRSSVLALAVRRGPAHRRGEASAHAAHAGTVRRGAAEAERRAGAHRRAVEVRVQERQVAGEDPLRREAAADELAARRRRRNTVSTRT